MKITKKQFEDYWDKKGRFLRIKNAERFYQNLADKIEGCGDSADLDEYIVSLKKGRETARRVVVDFYQYLGNVHPDGEPESDLYNKHFYDQPFERQLEIAKYLHTERTTAEIQEHIRPNQSPAVPLCFSKALSGPGDEASGKPVRGR